MIYINSSSSPVHADLTRLQKDLPNEFQTIRNMGTSRKWSILIYPNAQDYPLDCTDNAELYSCLYDYCVSNNLTGCLSPLHDMDLLPDGTSEVPHYHFFTVSKAPRTAQSIASLSYYLNGNLPPVKKVENELGYFRYFTHQDDLDKAEYSSDDIVCINGYNPPCSGNKVTQSATQELLDLAEQYYNMGSLSYYVMRHRRDLWNVLIRNSNLLREYYAFCVNKD